MTRPGCGRTARSRSAWPPGAASSSAQARWTNSSPGAGQRSTRPTRTPCPRPARPPASWPCARLGRWCQPGFHGHPGRSGRAVAGPRSPVPAGVRLAAADQAVPGQAAHPALVPEAGVGQVGRVRTFPRAERCAPVSETTRAAGSAPESGPESPAGCPGVPCGRPAIPCGDRARRPARRTGRDWRSAGGGLRGGRVPRRRLPLRRDPPHTGSRRYRADPGGGRERGRRQQDAQAPGHRHAAAVAACRARGPGPGRGRVPGAGGGPGGPRARCGPGPAPGGHRPGPGQRRAAPAAVHPDDHARRAAPLYEAGSAACRTATGTRRRGSPCWLTAWTSS